jgi:cob(I)alamin adenosyltransferase
MGYRLSKIVTRTGDDGTTGLGDGSRIAKSSSRIAAMGDVDELNSLLGLILCEDLDSGIRELLLGLQHDLFDLGGELAIPGSSYLDPRLAGRIENMVGRFNQDLSPLKEFILPGGSRTASLFHLARTVCRRAERAVVAIGAQEAVSDAVRQYLNRLSDLLFVLGRWHNRHCGGDVLWRKDRTRTD